MTKLKPCPFCGGEVEYGITWGSVRYIQCKNCNIKISGFNSKKDLINAWNNRPDPWQIGIPTEKGAYLIKLESQDKEVAYTIMPMEAVICGNKLHMKNDELSIVAWQKIEDKENGKE